MVALEASGRPLLVSNVDLAEARVGGLETDVVASFLQELAESAGLTVHVRPAGGTGDPARARRDLQGAGRGARPGAAAEP